MTDSTPYSLPSQPGRWRAIALAAVVHAGLFAFLWFGVNWQNQTPVAVEAEVWSPQAREAAPKAVFEPPPPPPPPAPRKPEPMVRTPPRPAPAVALPPRVETPQPKAPDIALERAKQRREQARERANEEARDEAERQKTLVLKAEAERRRKLQEQAEQKIADERGQKREQARLQQQLQQQQQREQQKQQQKQEQRQQQHAAQLAQAAEAVARKKAADLKQQAAEKQARAEAASEQKTAALREDQMRRLTESAGSGGSGDTPKSQGSRADPGYTQKVGAKIRNNTVFNGADEVSGNPSVEIAVELLPDGSIRRLRKTKGSGVPGFDEAVTRAIEKSQPFPPDKSGQVPSGFTVSHKPKDS